MNKSDLLEEKLAALEKENAYLKRTTKRLQQQQVRREHIDDLNRRLLKHLNLELDEARELAEQGSKAKSDFLANVSHEIRTPLNIILGMGELLSNSELNTVQSQYLRSLLVSGRHLLCIINNVLEFSRIESGMVEVAPEPFDVEQLLRNVESMVLPLALRKGIQFTTETGIIHKGRTGDAGKVKQILLNLLGNAIKFTPQGSVTLKLAEKKGPGGECGLLFEITDTGPGIPPEKQQLIFERFSQGHSANSKKKGGVGLGLAITQRLVSAMGGDLGLESNVGEGATFRAFLPMPVVEINDYQSFGRIHENISIEELPALKVLAADDFAPNVELIKQYLDGAPVELHGVANGAEAIAEFDRGIFDLILMDIRMPEVDGVSATKKIRSIEQNKGVRPTRIVAMTAHAFEEHKAMFLEAGFDDVLIKPFSQNELVQVLVNSSGSEFSIASGEYNEEGEHFKNGVRHERSVSDLVNIPPALFSLAPRALDAICHDFEKVSSALSEHDFTLLTDICHTIKGVAGLYGFHKLQMLTSELEKSAKSRDALFSGEIFRAIHMYVEQLKQEVTCTPANMTAEQENALEGAKNLGD